MLIGLARGLSAAADVTEWRWLFGLAQRAHAAAVWARGGTFFDLPGPASGRPRLLHSSAHSGGRRGPATRNPGTEESDAALVVGDAGWIPAFAGMRGKDDDYGQRLVNEGLPGDQPWTPNLVPVASLRASCFAGEASRDGCP